MHADIVQGGALLFTRELPALLPVDPDARPLAYRSREILETRKGKRWRRQANSAEAIRQMKRGWGVPLRPTTDPVDRWGRRPPG